MCHTEELMESSQFVLRSTERKHFTFIKNVIHQIKDIYEVKDSAFQNIENTVSYAKLGIMHRSIITLTDIQNELESYY